MVVTLVSIFVLLLLSAFFSGSETALTAASKPLMHRLESRDNKNAGLVNRLRDNKERLIGAILLGNNAVNILASALATSVLIDAFGEAGILYATLVMTLLVLIFAEILPKTYAFKKADQMALIIAPVVNGVVAILAPVANAINMIVKGVFRIFGVGFDKTDADGYQEELRGAIDLHQAGGDEEDPTIRHERMMLKSVLDLAQVQVGEIMTHRRNMTTIDASLDPETLLNEVLISPFTRIPLWRDDPDNIVGVLHAKDLLRAVRARRPQGDDELDAVDVVSVAQQPWFVPDTSNLFDQLQAFRERHEHFAIVIDEYGSIMGVVTLEDILEEIVGEIADEHDDAMASGIAGQPDGSYVVEGAVTIRDLNRELDWNLPDAEAATVAGLLLHESRRIPEAGQAFLFHGFRFEILTREKHRLTSIRIRPPEPE